MTVTESVFLRRAAAIALGIALANGPLQAAPVSGKVTIKGGSAGSTAFVYAEPLAGAATGTPGTFTVAQKDKAFQPRVLAVPRGATIAFPNRDSIFHNVFSLTRQQPFDLGLYRSGASKSVTFSTAGTYKVFCNIHPQMSATIHVVPTPHVIQTAADGSFRMDLPAGRYRLSVWSERSEATSVEIVVGTGSVTAPELTVDESRYVEAPHKNKFGQDYPKEAYDTKGKKE